MLSLSHRPVTAVPERAGRAVFAALQSVMGEVGRFFSGTWNSIAELRRARLELAAARDQLIEFEQMSGELAELRIQNAELRRQLAFAADTRFEHLSAQVLARGPGNLFTTVTISRGRRHGVAAGMAVVALQDGLQGLVGRVAEVGAGTSVVLPITARSSFVAARLQELRYDGLVLGAGDAGLMMRHVSKDAASQIGEGDLAITSGMGGVFPRGIQIGRVREVNAPIYQNSLELALTPLVDLSRLEYVFVITTPHAVEAN
jgi:rod shape-determining protein MreC